MFPLLCVVFELDGGWHLLVYSISQPEHIQLVCCLAFVGQTLLIIISK